jgi:hypothetical protein
MLGYHEYFARDRIYNETIADDKPFNDGWSTAEKFANAILKLKETPTSYAEGWMAGHKHKPQSGSIPMPPGHSPAWTHGFTAGYISLENKAIRSGYSDGWLAGRHAFLIGAPNNINATSHTENYKGGFNEGYQATKKDPLAGWVAFPEHRPTYTDCADY